MKSMQGNRGDQARYHVKLLLQTLRIFSSEGQLSNEYRHHASFDIHAQSLNIKDQHFLHQNVLIEMIASSYHVSS